MEWQEIHKQFKFDLTNKLRGNEGFVALRAIEIILQKLASEEAEKTKEKPAKGGFFTQIESEFEEGYYFCDDADNQCEISQNGNHPNKIYIGRRGKTIRLTQEMVRALLPLLQEFVENGEIS